MKDHLKKSYLIRKLYVLSFKFTNFLTTKKALKQTNNEINNFENIIKEYKNKELYFLSHLEIVKDVTKEILRRIIIHTK